MNSDRLIQMSSDTIVAGLTTKWTAMYNFLNFTWSSTLIDNQVAFDSLNSNQFSKDVAYYLEPEDLFFLLFQSKDKLISITNGIDTLILSESNIKQILIFKWKKGITQLSSILSNLIIDGEYLIFNYQMSTINTIDNKESSYFMIKTILSNYLENYFNYEDVNILYPQITLKYKLNWDLIKARFSNRMSLNLGHALSFGFDSKNIKINEQINIFAYLDGIPCYDINYVSSDESIVHIISGGTIIGAGVGTCTITATDTIYGTIQTCNIKVIEHELKLSSSLIYLYSGQNKKINAYIDGAKTTNISYSTSDSNIVSIDLNGNIIEGSNNGSCIITVTDNLYGLTKTCKIHKQSSLFNINTSGNFLLKYNKTFKIVSYYNSVKTKNVTYTSSDESLAVVDSDGLITCTNQSKQKINCTITITNKADNSTIQITIITQKFDVDESNLIAYWSAVGKTNNDANYNIWEDQTENSYNLLPYQNVTQTSTGLFSNLLTAGWQNNWFVFDSTSASSKGYWKIPSSIVNLYSNTNIALGIRIKSAYTSGEMQIIGNRQSTVNWQLKQISATSLLFETTIYGTSSQFTVSGLVGSDVTIVIQTKTATSADVYVNAIKIGTIVLSRSAFVSSQTTIGLEQQSSGWVNPFKGSIKAIALYDVTSQLKTDNELIELSQNLMAIN